MKKIAIVLIPVMAMMTFFTGGAAAMQLSGPSGNVVDGWFKDGFSLYIKHGTTTCTGSGTAYQYVYDPGSAEEGAHHYTIMADNVDNPYVVIDHSGSPTPLHMVCPPISPTIFTLVQEFDASVDSQPPYVNITDPNGSASTPGSSYSVSGFAGDMGSGVRSIHFIVNGVTGPESAINGSTFSITVPLNSGSNTVQMVAMDKVGHSANSNVVTITSGSGVTPSPSNSSGPSGGSGASAQSNASSGLSGNASGTSNTKTPASTPAASGGNTLNQAVKFNQSQVLSIQDSNDPASDPETIQATAALAGATGLTYKALWTIIVILFLLCAVIIWKFQPIFAELDRDKSGLRRRIIMIVTLPSLLPLLGLGLLGYQQLSNSVKNSLSSQLEKAAQTSALKLNREFNIRRTIITKTSSDILQIKSQYQAETNTLNKQKDNCATIVKANIPIRRYSTVTGSDDCLPFLTGFAQLASVNGASVTNYLDALNQGATQAQKDQSAQEQQRVDELLGSIKHYFPDIVELEIVDASKGATIQATLPRTDGAPTVTVKHSGLLRQAPTDYLALFDSSTKVRQLILTYPVVSGNQTLGGAIATFDSDNKYFIPSIWSSTPKPYETDQVYFLTTAGELITPKSGTAQLNGQIKSIASTASGKVYDLKLASQMLATRTSPVANTNWVVAVGAPASSILAPLAGIQRTALLAIAGFLLLSALLGIYFVSGIAGEIERLFRGALSFAKGDLDYRIALNSHDELQVLSETMNKMAADIKSAQDALVQKDKDFINVATHEIKAPMTSIIGNLSMVTEDGMGQIDATARSLIMQAYNGTIRLRDIVTDMLDIARLESGHAEFKTEVLDIRVLTRSIVDMQGATAQQSHITLNYQPTDNLPDVMADKNKLQIILTNFISNAIKYNRSGGSVTISQKAEADKLVVSVTDTGLGIPEDQQPHMFEKFFRVADKDRTNVPGTGLGLHITKRFIEGMGGTVWFESVHGKGTTFSFNIPTAPTNMNASLAPVQIAEELQHG